MKQIKVELEGKTFGYLLVKKGVGVYNGRTSYMCLCKCGTSKILTEKDLKSGHTQSCGCLGKEVRCKATTKHGQCTRKGVTSEYKSWCKMKERCCNDSNPDYKNYGGRGINVCPEWINSFADFFKDMGPKPSKYHSLERRDNDKGYSKDNCYWATRKEQANNNRRNRNVTYNGETKTLSQWKDIIGFDYEKVKWRLNKGMSAEDAFLNAIR